MATIVTRAGKGSPLTNAEVDANFVNLNTELAGKALTSSLAAVATSGAYSDLSGVPTTVSSFTNDAGYITSSSGITGNAATATKLATARTIALAGDVTGSATFDGSANISITATVADDSHNHIIGNVDGLQAALDGKQAALGYTPANRAGDTFTGTVNIGGAVYRSWSSADTDIDALIGGSTFGALIEGGSNGHMTIGLRSNDVGDGFQVISKQAGDATYTLKCFEVTAGGVAHFGGDLFVPDSIKHAGDADTAIRFPANDTFTVETAGIERLRVDSSGSVAASVDVRAPIFRDSDNTGFYVDPAGSVSANFAGRIQLPYQASTPASGPSLSWGSGNVSQLGLYVGSGLNYQGNSSNLSFRVRSPTTDGTLGSVFVDFNPSSAIAEVTGSVRASVDMRSPIYYDSDNTAYYVNPNGNSIFNGSLTVNGGITGSLSGNASTATTLQTARTISLTGDVTGSVSFDGSANASITTTVADDSHNHIIANIDGLQAALDGKQAAGSYAAASHTHTTADITNLSSYTGLDARYYTESESDLRFANAERGALATPDSQTASLRRVDPNAGNPTNEHYAMVTYGNSGNVTGQLATHFQNGASYVRAYNSAWSSWQRLYADNYHPEADRLTTARTISLAGDATGSVSFNGSANVTLTAAVVDDSHGHSFNNLLNKTSGTGTYTTSGDFRASIFYDSDNTAYYADLSSTGTAIFAAGGMQLYGQDGFRFTSASAVSAMRFGSAFTGESTAELAYDRATGQTILSAGNTGSALTQLFSINTTGLTLAGTTHYINTDKLLLQHNGTDGYIRSVNAGSDLYLGGSNQNTLTLHASNYAVIAGSTRSPFFYDSDNTAYYVNPAATSVMATVQTDNINCRTGTQLILNGGDAAGVATGQTGELIYLNAEGGIQINSSPDNWASGWAGRRTATICNASGDSSFPATVSAGNDFRAPIFYDSQNTSYFVDPQNTSVLWEAATYYLRNIADVSTDHPYGVYFASNRSSAYAIYRESGAWTHPYPDLRIAFHTGIKLGANAGYQGIRFYNDYDMVTQVMSVNNGSDPLGANNVYVNYTLQAGDSLRAPIFYDSNNTGYYVDPASSSYVSGDFQIQQSGINGLRVISGTGTQSLWVRAGYDTDGSPTPVSSPLNIQFQSSGNSGGSFTFVSGNTKALTITGDYAQGAGSLRAPIFYDSDNTGYYVDPAGTSFTNISVSGAGLAVVDASAVANDPYGLLSVTRRTDANYSYLGFTRAGQMVYQMGIDTSNRFWIGGGSAGYNGVRSDTYLSFSASGDVTAKGDFRAPIFYDSNNTAYYTDPASTSILNVMQAINTQHSAGDGNGMRFWTNDGYKIYMSSTGNGTWGGRVAGEATSDYNMYFRMTGGTNRGFVFRNNTTNVAGIDASGNGRFIGDVTAGGSVRAPIFYDSNDTGYYVDPASESVLNTVTFFGELNLSAAGQTYVDHTGTIIFRNQSGYATSATLTTSGNFTATGNVTAYSDIRVKDNVEQISGALDRLQAVRGVTYTRNDLEDKERRYAGVIAQEIEQVLPEAVFERDDRKAVDYNATIGLLIEAIKELKSEVETLKANIQ